MRRNIFMYLFLFAALWIVFQYVNNTKVYESQQKTITKLEERLATQDSLNTQLGNELSMVSTFSLATNTNAQEYFENDALDIDTITQKVSDGLYEMNTPTGNALIPYEGDGKAFQINSVQLLNHRWLIADFSDGKNWGEVLVSYFINEDSSVDYEMIDSIIYP